MHVALMQQEARGEVELVDGQEGGSLDVMMPFMIWAVWICVMSKPTNSAKHLANLKVGAIIAKMMVKVNHGFL